MTYDMTPVMAKNKIKSFSVLHAKSQIPMSSNWVKMLITAENSYLLPLEFIILLIQEL